MWPQGGTFTLLDQKMFILSRCACAHAHTHTQTHNNIYIIRTVDDKRAPCRSNYNLFNYILKVLTF